MNTTKGIGRKAFLRGVIGVLGAGTGLAATSSSTQAAPPQIRCCKTGDECPNCVGAPVKYKCFSECDATTWCVCHANVGQCYNYGC